MHRNWYKSFDNTYIHHVKFFRCSNKVIRSAHNFQISCKRTSVIIQLLLPTTRSIAMKRRSKLVSLVILCVSPLAFRAIGAYREVKTVNIHRASSNNVTSSNNAVCALDDSEFGSGPGSADLPLCSLKESEDEIGPNNGFEGSSSLTALQRLTYELVAAAVARHAATALSNNCATGQQHAPKHIKKRLPGLKRKKWKEISLSFSRNALLRNIFYGSHRRHCSIADFLQLICHTLRFTSAVFMRYSIAVSVFWVRYAAIRTRHSLHCFCRKCASFCTRKSLHCFCRKKKTQLKCITLQLQIFVRIARTISLSFAVEFIFELRRKILKSRKSSNTLHNRILRSIILCTRPLFIGSDGFECNYLSLLNVAVTLIAVTVSFVKRQFQQFPTLQQAQEHIIMIELCRMCPPTNDRCGAKSKRSASPPTPRLHRKSTKLTALLQFFVILSLPTLVLAPNKTAAAAAAAAASNFQAAGAAIIGGSGVAAYSSSVVYYANRTRKWTEKEKELEELCLSYDVEYLTPPQHENKDQQAVRRKIMVDACQRAKKEQRRVKDEEALEKLCLEKGVTYIPPPPNETDSQQRNRRRNLKLACDDELRLNRALDKKRRRKNETQKEKEAEATRRREARAKETAQQKEDRLRDQAERARQARANETAQQTADRRHADAQRTREAREAKRKAEEEAYHEEDTFINDEIPDIEVSLEGVKEALEYLLRTDDGSGQHQAVGCTICDEFIIGTEDLCCVPKERILQHRDRLGVTRYQDDYFGGQAMDEELKKQYEIKGMEGILLSKRFGKDDADEFPVCSSCRDALRKDNIDKSPPKKSIANGFLIGSIPKVITYEKDGVEENISTVIETFDAEGNRNQTISKVTSILAAALSPVRPFSYIFSYRGGRHKSLVGNFQFFDTDQSKVAGALQCLHKSGVDANIYVVLNGKMTPTQKQIVRRKAELDKELYFGLLRWLKKHHPAFKDVDIGDEEGDLKVELIEDEETGNNRDDESDNPDLENKEEGATFYFSSAGEPSTDTSVYDTTKDLVLALLKNHSAPTLSIHGGKYSTHSDVMHLENVFPTVFPFGSGGPTLKRSHAISKEEIIRHYLRLSLPQFMESEFILVANYLLGRILSFESAKIKCRPRLDEDGNAVGDEIGKMTVEEIQAATEDEQRNGSTDSNGVKGRANMFLKAVRASCRQLGMSEEAAKSARRKCFALQDHFGLHSLFVTITIDDECSFRVRLYPSVDANGNGVSVSRSALLLHVCVSHDLIHRFSVVLLPYLLSRHLSRQSMGLMPNARPISLCEEESGNNTQVHALWSSKAAWKLLLNVYLVGTLAGRGARGVCLVSWRLSAARRRNKVVAVCTPIF